MDRSYYLAQDKATDVYRMVRAFVIYLILICILPWCNFGLWNLIDYSSMKVERQGDKLVISDTVDEFVTRETSVVEHYYSYYRCSCCNRSVRFKGKRLVGKEVTYRDREGRK